jgi:hypothetical protein
MDWVSQPHAARFIRSLIQKFIKGYREDQNEEIYENRIVEMSKANRQSLEINYPHLSKFNRYLSDWVILHPEIILPYLNDVAFELTCEIFPRYSDICKEIFVRIRDIPETINLRNLKCEDIGHLIKINGVKALKGNGTYSVVPDQIEAGTYLLAAMATKGDITIHNCISKHLESLTSKIEEMGGHVEELPDDSIRVWTDTRPKKCNIKTLPYPGFPTDLQPQAGVCLALADGTSILNETIWESRFQYTEELNKMGAHITAQGKTAVFEGVESLSGAPVSASDLRAGAALLIAGMASNGKTELSNISLIDRGYECIEEKFTKLGAKIKRIDVEE